MKKFSLTFLITTLAFVSFAQIERVQGTLTLTSPNSIMAVIRPSASFSGQFTNVQFTLQIPSSVTPRPVVTIKSNPLAPSFVPTYLPVVVGTEGAFYTYLFATVVTGGTPYNFVANTPVNALELEVSGAVSPTQGPVRLAHLPDGGSIGQYAFYVEIGGVDNTNYTTMFYGPGASNGGSYSALSNIPVNGVVLPLNITDFKATRSNDNGLLSWTVENESPANSHFELERSLNGVSFTEFARLNVAGNGSSSNVYNFTDLKITDLQHKGVIYYRLKQVDRDGQFVYSVVRSIRLDKNKVSLGLYPNPSATSSMLTMDLPEAGRVSISISDAGGKIVDRLEIVGVKGINQKKIDVSKYASGTYMLRASAGDDVQTLSLVVSK